VSLRPLLVTQRLVGCDGIDEVRECLDRRWGGFLRQLGLVPVPLASGAGVEAYLECLQPAGVLLSGGNDLACVGGDELCRARDAFETRVVELGRARGLPILGVCRGMQLLAHLSGVSIDTCSGHVATLHALEPSGNARHPALRIPRVANSFHQFSARPRPGSEFQVVLRSADGAAEAIEHVSLPIVGIMWHPERYATPCSLDLELFQQVFGA
jgi:N5-(cytidine 5'-diphosphoramidyl)-L-glutamine hydrolase